GRISTNAYAKKVQELFDKDMELTNYYHKEMANGKWNHMMSQTHIGYRSWQEPRANTIPKTTTIEESSGDKIGVSIEVSNEWWSGTNNNAILPTFDVYNNQKYSIEIFNRNKNTSNYQINIKDKWVKISEPKGTLTSEKKIEISIDWKKAPKGIQSSLLTVLAGGQEIPIQIKTNNYKKNDVKGFVENNGYIAIDAEHFSNKYEPEPF